MDQSIIFGLKQERKKLYVVLELAIPQYEPKQNNFSKDQISICGVFTDFKDAKNFISFQEDQKKFLLYQTILNPQPIN